VTRNSDRQPARSNINRPEASSRREALIENVVVGMSLSPTFQGSIEASPTPPPANHTFPPCFT
jgi:hypothetical protein